MLMRTLAKLSIENFKSIRKQTLALGALNVFIGGNGSGKSNLISVFRFLREIVTKNLQSYTAMKGGANSILHYGVKNSRSLTIRLDFDSGLFSNAYSVSLVPTADDNFFIFNEVAYYHDKVRYPNKPFDFPVSSSTTESKLRDTDHICARQAMDDLESYRVYHFHDTSDTAAVKQTADIDDNEYLRPHAENLASFLFWMQEKEPDH